MCVSVWAREEGPSSGGWYYVKGIVGHSHQRHYLALDWICRLLLMAKCVLNEVEQKENCHIFIQ